MAAPLKFFPAISFLCLISSITNEVKVNKNEGDECQAASYPKSLNCWIRITLMTLYYFSNTPPHERALWVCPFFLLEMSENAQADLTE